MNRLIVVSHRLPDRRADAPIGDVNALFEALAQTAHIWVGGVEGADHPRTSEPAEDGPSYARVAIGLTNEQNAAMAGMVDRALRPVLYSRLDIARFDTGHYLAWRRIGARFADTVARFAGTGDPVVVHNHHLIPVARELRRQGLGMPVGFFLEAPFPDADVFAALPWARELAEDLLHYDLVGFQTEICRGNFQSFVEQYCGGRMSGRRIIIDGNSTVLGVFPTGIDAGRTRDVAQSPDVDQLVHRIRDVLHGRTGIVGLERPDETSGILDSFRALEALFEQAPEFTEQLCLLQVSNGPETPEQRVTEGEIRAMSDCINGCYGSERWKPIHFARRAVTRPQSVALLRACRVGLMARPRSGMGLAAKDYIAVQDSDDPGVLVLSRHAGAACELTEAVLVDPHDEHSIAAGLREATSMPRGERRARWSRMMRKVAANDAQHWRDNLLSAVLHAHESNPKDLFTARRRVH